MLRSFDVDGICKDAFRPVYVLVAIDQIIRVTKKPSTSTATAAASFRR